MSLSEAQQSTACLLDASNHPVKAFRDAACPDHVLDHIGGSFDQQKGSPLRGVLGHHKSPTLHGLRGKLKPLDDVELDEAGNVLLA